MKHTKDEIGYFVIKKQRVVLPNGKIIEILAEITPEFSTNIPNEPQDEKGYHTEKHSFQEKSYASDNPFEIHIEKATINTESLVYFENNPHTYYVIKSHRNAIKRGICPICKTTTAELRQGIITSIDFLKGQFVCCFCRKKLGGDFVAKEKEKMEVLPRGVEYKPIPQYIRNVLEEKKSKTIIEKKPSFKCREIQGGSLEEHIALKELERLNKQNFVSGKVKMSRVGTTKH